MWEELKNRSTNGQKRAEITGVFWDSCTLNKLVVSISFHCVVVIPVDKNSVSDINSN